MQKLVVQLPDSYFLFMTFFRLLQHSISLFFSLLESFVFSNQIHFRSYRRCYQCTDGSGIFQLDQIPGKHANQGIPCIFNKPIQRDNNTAITKHCNPKQPDDHGSG